MTICMNLIFMLYSECDSEFENPEPVHHIHYVPASPLTPPLPLSLSDIKCSWPASKSLILSISPINGNNPSFLHPVWSGSPSLCCSAQCLSSSPSLYFIIASHSVLTISVSSTPSPPTALSHSFCNARSEIVPFPVSLLYFIFSLAQNIKLNLSHLRPSHSVHCMCVHSCTHRRGISSSILPESSPLTFIQPHTFTGFYCSRVFGQMSIFSVRKDKYKTTENVWRDRGEW